MARITEPELTLVTLQILNKRREGITTTELKQKLRDSFRPKVEDTKILKNRPDDAFSQIVRNIVSHRKQATSIVYKGLAEYFPGRPSGVLKITEAGITY